MVHHFPMIARAQDGDRLFVASTGLRYLARNWKFESISLHRRVNKLSVPLKTAPVVRSHDPFAVERPVGRKKYHRHSRRFRGLALLTLVSLWFS
jgi:hypothetical protein